VPMLRAAASIVGKLETRSATCHHALTAGGQLLMKDLLTAERARALLREALEMRERLVVMDGELHGYSTAAKASRALPRAAHELANAAEGLVELAEHLERIEAEK
jgi:hypothetical protein